MLAELHALAEDAWFSVFGSDDVDIRVTSGPFGVAVLTWDDHEFHARVAVSPKLAANADWPKLREEFRECIIARFVDDFLSEDEPAVKDSGDSDG